MSIKTLLTRILNAIKSLQDRDYIIEEGTSGRWTYRKWNSGIAECWKWVTEDNLAMTTAEGYAYYSPYKTYPYPAGLFIGSPEAQVSAECSDRLVTCHIDDNNQTNIHVYYSCSVSNTRKVYGHISSKGRWK